MPVPVAGMVGRRAFAMSFEEGFKITDDEQLAMLLPDSSETKLTQETMALLGELVPGVEAGCAAPPCVREPVAARHRKKWAPPPPTEASVAVDVGARRLWLSDDIRFVGNAATILDESLPLLDALGKALKAHPGVAVRLVPADDIKKYRNGKDVLHDGCLHLHAAPPLPWSLVDEFELPLVDGKHAFPAQCVATEGPRAQALGGFSITY